MIRTERREHIEVVELDRPPLHLFDEPLMEALRERFEQLAADPPRIVQLRCDGGGADIRELVRLDPDSGRRFITELHRACACVRALDVPVIGFVDRHCFGAHLELYAACDLRVASHEARFAMPEVKVGIPSVIDACWLVRICGLGDAARLVFDGGPIDADEALRLHLVNRLADDARAEALAWATDLAATSPFALAQQKRVLRDWTEAWYSEAVASSIDRFAETFTRPEAHEAMRAFLEKREPRF